MGRSNFVEVLITAGSPREARRLARHLVERRLAACVNLHPVRSVYRWRGGVEEAREVALAAKTTRARYPALEAEVRRLHSYEVPCIVALPVESGSPSYLEWVRGASAPEPRSAMRRPGLLRSPPASRSAMRRRRTRSRKRI